MEERKKGGMGETGERKSKGKFFFYIHKLNIRRHRKQHGGCEAWRMNPASGQWSASANAGWTIPTDQQSGSHTSASKLLLLIFKGGNYWGG